MENVIYVLTDISITREFVLHAIVNALNALVLLYVANVSTSISFTQINAVRAELMYVNLMELAQVAILAILLLILNA
jgi:hypothetical protein